MFSAFTGTIRIPINKISTELFSKAEPQIPEMLREKAEQEPKLLNFLKENIDLNYLSKYAAEINSDDLDQVKAALPANNEILINYGKINNFRWINQYFIEANAKLKQDGVFIGMFESIAERHIRLAKKYTFLPKWIISFYDFTMFRVIPKLPKIRVLFFSITKGKNRAISLAEMLGRLTFCGFDLVSLKEINNYMYYIAVKKREPKTDTEPSYGPLIKMKRVSKDFKTINVYKFRTMHPYSEYLQQFIYDNLNLKDGGKFNEDFRITSWGRILRKFWIDELPMITNLLKGELKLVGIRPLSPQYLSLYKPETIEKRSKVKPGLVPPFYVDLPVTLDEIQDSETRYIDQYLKEPIKTDWVYFWKAVYNIIFKKARSS